MRIKYLLTIGCFCGFFLFPVGFKKAGAVWEIGPLSPSTRLLNHQPARWEFSLVITPETIYPGEFICPANYSVTLHILNLTGEKKTLAPENNLATYALYPGKLKTVALGVLPKGKHFFYIHTPLSDPDGNHPMEDSRMKCTINADTWPGYNAIYQATWIIENHCFYPATLRLPSARFSDVLIAGGVQTQPGRFKAADFVFEVKPRDVSMTEFRQPSGVQLNIPVEKGAQLSIQ